MPRNGALAAAEAEGPQARLALADSIAPPPLDGPPSVVARLCVTLGALVIYRLGCHIPLPGIDPQILAGIFSRQSGGILGMFDMFSGGALGRMTIFALGLVPYITASVCVLVLSVVSPRLRALAKQGAAGPRALDRYARIGAVFLAAVQAYGIAVGLEGTGGGHSPVIDPGLFFRATTVATLTGGTVFLRWLGEQITARGVGNGISLIIFSGIVARMPAALGALLEMGRVGSHSYFFIALLLFGAVAVVTFIVFMERAQRRILVQYPKRQVGNKMFGGEASHLPLKLYTSGVIPPIFASSLLLLPATTAGFSADKGGWLADITSYIGRGHPIYLLLYVALIIFFAFFYTAIVFNPTETVDNLRKYGGFVPGIRPGKNTADYLDYVLTRLTVIGSLYLAAVCVLPELLNSQMGLTIYFGGTSLLIVVSVTMDTVAQMPAVLKAR